MRHHILRNRAAAIDLRLAKRKFNQLVVHRIVVRHAAIVVIADVGLAQVDDLGIGAGRVVAPGVVAPRVDGRTVGEKQKQNDHPHPSLPPSRGKESARSRLNPRFFYYSHPRFSPPPLPNPLPQGARGICGPTLI